MAVMKDNARTRCSATKSKTLYAYGTMQSAEEDAGFARMLDDASMRRYEMYLYSYMLTKGMKMLEA